MSAAIFPSSAIRRSVPPAASKPLASREAVESARVAVRGLLHNNRSYNALPDEKRRQLAHDLVRIGTYLAEPDGIRLKQQSTPVRALADDQAARPPAFGQAVK